MNCSTFKNRISDIIEGNYKEDLKDATKKHMEECEECRKYYEDEMNIEHSFKNFYSLEGITFNSSRQEIMKRIDKDRYKSSRIKTHLKRNARFYASAAAVIIFAFIILPIMARSTSGSTGAMPESMSKTNNSDAMNQSKAAGNANDMAFKQSYPMVCYFQKKETLDDENGSLKNFVDNNEKNISLSSNSILVEDKKTTTKEVYSLDNLTGEQLVPKYLGLWKDDRYLLAILGTNTSLANGGAIYVIDLTTGVANLISAPRTETEYQSFSIENGAVTCSVIVYEDAGKTKFHTEKITISKENINSIVKELNNVSIEASIVFMFEEYVNNRKYSEALTLLGPSEKSLYQGDNIKYLQNIESMKVSDIIPDTTGYKGNRATQDNYSQIKVYKTSVDYRYKDTSLNNGYNGVRNIYFVLGKLKKNSLWEIIEMPTAP